MKDKKTIYILVHVLQNICLFIALFPIVNYLFKGDLPSGICLLIGLAGLIIALVSFALPNYLFLKCGIHNYKTMVRISTIVNMVIVLCYFCKHYMF